MTWRARRAFQGISARPGPRCAAIMRCEQETATRENMIASRRSIGYGALRESIRSRGPQIRIVEAAAHRLLNNLRRANVRFRTFSPDKSLYRSFDSGLPTPSLMRGSRDVSFYKPFSVGSVEAP